MLSHAFSRGRVSRDLAELMDTSISCFLPHADVCFRMLEYDGDCEVLLVVIQPREGIYKGASFSFRMLIGAKYPFKPPIVQCDHRVLHPNISSRTGEVSLRMLSPDWSPVLTLRLVVLALVLLFVEPHLDSAINDEAAFLLASNPRGFREKVRQSIRDLGCEIPSHDDYSFSAQILQSSSNSGDSGDDFDNNSNIIQNYSIENHSFYSLGNLSSERVNTKRSRSPDTHVNSSFSFNASYSSSPKTKRPLRNENAFDFCI